MYLAGFKLVYSVYDWYSQPSSLLVATYMKYLFPTFHFQPICVFISKFSLLQTEYIQIIFFSIYSVNICFFIGKFNPFTFEVLTDKEELTSVIMPFVFCMSYSVFFPHFYHSCLLLWLITSVVTCFDSLIISFSVYSVKLFWLPWGLRIIS